MSNKFQSAVEKVSPKDSSPEPEVAPAFSIFDKTSEDTQSDDTVETVPVQRELENSVSASQVTDPNVSSLVSRETNVAELNVVPTEDSEKSVQEKLSMPEVTKDELSVNEIEQSSDADQGVNEIKVVSSVENRGRIPEADDNEDDDEEEENVNVIIRNVKSQVKNKPVVLLPVTTAAPPEDPPAPKIDVFGADTINGVPLAQFDIDAIADKPWRKPGADITDYFNYGFTEETWKAYCLKAHLLRGHNGLSSVGHPNFSPSTFVENLIRHDTDRSLRRFSFLASKDVKADEPASISVIGASEATSRRVASPPPRASVDEVPPLPPPQNDIAQGMSQLLVAEGGVAAFAGIAGPPHPNSRTSQFISPAPFFPTNPHLPPFLPPFESFAGAPTGPLPPCPVGGMLPPGTIAPPGTGPPTRHEVQPPGTIPANLAPNLNAMRPPGTSSPPGFQRSSLFSPIGALPGKSRPPSMPARSLRRAPPPGPISPRRRPPQSSNARDRSPPPPLRQHPHHQLRARELDEMERRRRSDDGAAPWYRSAPRWGRESKERKRKEPGDERVARRKDKNRDREDFDKEKDEDAFENRQRERRCSSTNDRENKIAKQIKIEKD